ncbi:MAG: hypothetical protein HKN40_13755 [Winogradskyella sp.]|uniref:hypothetical protein n=1 Tax=Winogradskyella sp. TaxID=1883156 RepID=UPI00184ABDC4|nr:hypothetical protein [Winogradskyella sp.]
MQTGLTNKSKFIIVLIIVVLLQLLLSFQGFDICDDGFVLTFYQQIFQNPESVEYNFLYWFSGIVGGLWYQIYEDGGVFWFRMLALIVNTSTFVITYHLLKRHMRQDFLLLALTMVLFVNDYGFLTFYHNQLTALMTVLIIYVLSKAITKNVMTLFILSGILISFNTVVRIPNLVLTSFLLVIPFGYFIKFRSLKRAIKPTLFCSLGIVLGFALVYSILIALDQVVIMKNALLTIFDLGKTENSSHNFKSIFTAPLYNYYHIIVTLVQFAAIVMFLIFSNRFFSKISFGKFLLSISTIGLLLYWINTGNIYPIYGLCLLGSIIILWSKHFNSSLKVLACFSLLTLITLTLGSAGGINNSGYMAIWLGLPLFFLAMQNFNLYAKKNGIATEVIQSIFNNNLNNRLLYCLALAFFAVKSYNIYNGAYFDSGSRYLKTYAINDKLAQGIYTTEKRAQIINDLLVNLEDFVAPGDYLFAYDKIPMVHFLTETKPYMYNPWVWIYDYNSFRKKLNKAEHDIPVLPVVVQQKFETISNFSEPIEDYMSVHKENSDLHSNERNKAMRDFLTRHNYTVVWSNAYFNIYKTPKSQ